jgi:hypothetical protein
MISEKLKNLQEHCIGQNALITIWRRLAPGKFGDGYLQGDFVETDLKLLDLMRISGVNDFEDMDGWIENNGTEIMDVCDFIFPEAGYRISPVFLYVISIIYRNTEKISVDDLTEFGWPEEQARGTLAALERYKTSNAKKILDFESGREIGRVD